MSWFSDFTGINIDLNADLRGGPDIIKVVEDAGKQIVQGVVNTAQGATTFPQIDLLQDLGRMRDGVTENLAGIPGAISNAGEGLRQVAGDVVRGAEDAVSDAGKDIGRQLNAIGDWTNNALNDASHFLGNVYMDVGGHNARLRREDDNRRQVETEQEAINTNLANEQNRKRMQDISASTAAGLAQGASGTGYNLGASSVRNYNTSKDFLGL